MSLRQLPEAQSFARPQNLQWDAPSDVLARWAEKPLAAVEGEDTITIFDVIGEDWWTGGGFTAKRAAAALRSIGNKPVTVQINSPGGDLFEGLAIFNLLREHKSKVTIEVLGWAASAASIIAMAGDEIVMGLGTFMMVHNAWGAVIGNRHDFREAADLFESFDGAIADIYEARVGDKSSRKDIEKLMDAETFLSPSEAVAKGFADRVDDALGSKVSESQNADRSSVLARRRTEAALARAGFTRSQRSEMLAELINNPAARDAGRDAALDAGVDLAAVRQFMETLKS
jgi:ATP-dependent protease ClpP protease subunit